MLDILRNIVVIGWIFIAILLMTGLLVLMNNRAWCYAVTLAFALMSYAFIVALMDEVAWAWGSLPFISVAAIIAQVWYVSEKQRERQLRLWRDLP